MTKNVLGTFIYEIPPREICVEFPPRVNSVGLWNSSEHTLLNITTLFGNLSLPLPDRSLPLLEMELTLMYVLTQFSYFFLKMLGLPAFAAQLVMLGLPAFAAQLVAGILLGDVGFHRITEVFQNQNPMFTFGNQEILNVIALLGYTLFTFLIGVKIDLSLVTKTGRKAMYIGLSNFLVSMIAGMGAVVYFHLKWRLGNGQVVQLIFATTVQCMTTTPVVASLLSQLKILNSELGRLGLSSVLVSDLFSVAVVVVGFVAKIMSFDLLRGARHLGVVVSFTLFAFYVGRPIMHWMIKQTPEGKPVKNTYVLYIMVAFLCSGLITHWCDMTVVPGPFILGLAVPSGPPLGSTLVKKLDFMTNRVFMPVFVITCVMRVTLTREVPRPHWWVVVATGIIIVLVSVTKFVASLVPALCCKMPVRDAVALALIMSSKGVVEMAAFSFARDTWVIVFGVYNVLMYNVVLNAIIVPVLVKLLYDPKKKYTAYQNRNMMHSLPDSELRILACIHRSDNTPAIINLLDAACPTRESPIAVYVLHLIELVGRTTPVFISHKKNRRTLSNYSSCSENVIVSFNHFERDNDGAVHASLFTAISPSEYMHDDVCTLALEKLTSLIIVPFHRKWSSFGEAAIESENQNIRTLNFSLLETAPCSVGILVNRGRIKCADALISPQEAYRVALIFLGGNDDREAFCLAKRMIDDSCISLTVIHLIDASQKEEDDDVGSDKKWELVQDKEMLKHMSKHSGRGYASYVEEMVEDAAQTTRKIRSLLDEDEYDLFIVGRRHNVRSTQTLGLDQWSEFPELGVIGDMLSSTDSSCKSSVLVIQQQQQKRSAVADQAS